jgi:hypothetical protein
MAMSAQKSAVRVFESSYSYAHPPRAEKTPTARQLHRRRRRTVCS